MSIAGILSNRGDIYQTLVAFDWALTVLIDPDYQWIEIDSTAHLVDDVVIGKADGSLICCQCKKNEPNFRAWSISNLSDELDKAALELANNGQVQVRFYSRDGFGKLAKLHEYSSLHSNETDYLAELTKEHKKTNSDLAACINAQAPNLSAYEFIRRTYFETSQGFDRMESLLRERLQRMVSNSDVAYNALYTRLAKLSGRTGNTKSPVSSQHRLTKEDIKKILHESGSMLVQQIDESEVRQSFANTSSIGRHWNQSIAGHYIPSPVVDELLKAVDAKARSVLLTGPPGSGKTCVMLGLQKALEQRMQTSSDLVSLFIQSREFVDLATAQDRQAHGLPEKWVEQATRLAEGAHVIVVIDSLDVLSIAREHNILTYFLAQIDQLLLVPNITVVTACRDFDRKYDRRIATRQWDCELTCPPLSWEDEIVPLLNKLEIDSANIDAATHQLIRNPRELAMFVELAQRDGSFNVVTSQALGQRYLDAIVGGDHELGSAAMQAIEDIADEMLRSRSLSISIQRFNASDDILRRLQSLNILLVTHDGQLTFGHQTLLDVLVISGALRRGVSLNEFIQNLPPVPFVRPSIRSFVEQLASGDRLKFRQQLRAVLQGNSAFHIRRLVAEVFAKQKPHDGDWSMIRNLHTNHREIFQVIYSQASSIEWHCFWLAHLVPTLKEAQNTRELITHIYRVRHWANEDAESVLSFWMEAMALDWLDSSSIAESLVFSLSDLSSENLLLATPLLKQVLNMPKPEYGLLGRLVANSVIAGALDDKALWDYIAGEVAEDDLLRFNFNNKLRCEPHEFGGKDENFLRNRMISSTVLLDLALETLESWSQFLETNRGAVLQKKYRYGFLDGTSYNDARTQSEHNFKNGKQVLLGAIEAAVLEHAQSHSDWWQDNRERLCFNSEGSLVYFSILALTANPEKNKDLIGRFLCDSKLLEFALSYELGTLLQAAFIYLDSHQQDLILATIHALYEEEQASDSRMKFWVLRKQAEYVSAIPCHLRSSAAQTILEEHEKIEGKLYRQPDISRRSGIVVPPFPYEEFLNASDSTIIFLLAHYTGFEGRFDDFLVGGEREVGWQLREASSRHPLRFLELLASHWANIASGFCNDIMDGISEYLARRYGDLQAKNTWVPVDEPDAIVLANQILYELGRHPSHWRHNRSAAKALKACAHVIKSTEAAERLVFLSLGFVNLREESPFIGGPIDLLTTGINMATGNIAEALMILANNLLEQGVALPELLPPALFLFAGNEHPAVRALILRRLPYLQYQNPKLGWKLFDCAMQDSVGLWDSAELCLYYAYRQHFEKIAPFLKRLLAEGGGKDLETWGRISALSSLEGYIVFADLLKELNTLNATEAWEGAASVWAHTENIKQHREQCLAGIEAGLKANGVHAAVVAQQVGSVFRGEAPLISLPIELIQQYFAVLEANSEKHSRLFGFDEWLNAISQQDPELALAAAEAYLTYADDAKLNLHDINEQLVQLITRLFAEAEEQEESDKGAMLERVVLMQDLLLSLGVDTVEKWLQMADRQ